MPEIIEPGIKITIRSVFLTELIAIYLRDCNFWAEHREHTGTWRQWEDLKATRPEERFLPTDLACCRQLAYEAQFLPRWNGVPDA